MSGFLRGTIMAGCVALACTGNALLARDDETPADTERLEKSGEIMSKSDLLKRVRTQYPGNVVDTELERTGGRYVYAVDLVDEKGVKRKLRFDARTGKQIGAPAKDADPDDDD
jgi:uncharacterized membrane protein YkoI